MVARVHSRSPSSFYYGDQRDTHGWRAIVFWLVAFLLVAGACGIQTVWYWLRGI